jgi:hypothetical protein
MRNNKRPLYVPHLHAGTAQALATTTFATVCAQPLTSVHSASVQLMLEGAYLALSTGWSPMLLFRGSRKIRERQFRAACRKTVQLPMRRLQCWYENATAKRIGKPRIQFATSVRRFGARPGNRLGGSAQVSARTE